MTKYLYTLLITLFLLSDVLIAQQAKPMQRLTESIHFELQDQQGKALMIVSNTFDQGDIVDITSLVLDDADLVLQCGDKLRYPRKLRFELEVRLTRTDQHGVLATKFISSENVAEVFEIRFKDLTEKGLFLNHSYQLEIIKSIFYDGLDDSFESPKFGPKLKGLSYPAIIVGTGAVLLGELVYRKQEEDAYGSYLGRWTEGAINDGDLYDEFETIRDRRKLATTAGYISLGTGIAILGYQWFTVHRPNKNIFETYRANNGSTMIIQPARFSVGGMAITGISLRYNF